MMEARVISATFSDWRTVKGRKQLQLIFEVPLEKQGEVLTMLGPPDSVGDKWVAIALLKDKPQAETPQASEASGSSKPTRQRSLAEECAIVCADARFSQFLLERFAIIPGETPAEFVRRHCGISTRAELNVNHLAARKWESLHSDFRNWLATKEYEGVRR